MRTPFEFHNTNIGWLYKNGYYIHSASTVLRLASYLTPSQWALTALGSIGIPLANYSENQPAIEMVQTITTLLFVYNNPAAATTTLLTNYLGDHFLDSLWDLLSEEERNRTCWKEFFAALHVMKCEASALAGERVSKSITRNNQAATKVTQPQITQPQITQPQVTQPQVTQPQVTQPQVTQPQVIQLPVIQFTAIQSQIRQPEVRQPEVIQPEVIQPEVIQPEVIQRLKPSFMLKTYYMDNVCIEIDDGNDDFFPYILNITKNNIRQMDIKLSTKMAKEIIELDKFDITSLINKFRQWDIKTIEHNYCLPSLRSSLCRANNVAYYYASLVIQRIANIDGIIAFNKEIILEKSINLALHERLEKSSDLCLKGISDLIEIIQEEINRLKIWTNSLSQVIDFLDDENFNFISRKASSKYTTKSTQLEKKIDTDAIALHSTATASITISEVIQPEVIQCLRPNCFMPKADTNIELKVTPTCYTSRSEKSFKFFENSLNNKKNKENTIFVIELKEPNTLSEYINIASEVKSNGGDKRAQIDAQNQAKFKNG